MWEAAVNLHPDILLRAVAKPDQPQTKDSKKVSKIITLKLDVEEFINSKYSLKEGFAVLAKKIFQINFDKFERIRDAYKLAFNQEFTVLDTEKDRSLFSLAQTRNVIVHSAGVADPHFIETMVDISSPIPQFVGLQDTQRVPIDGEIVASVVGNAINSCIKLVKDVDDWLVMQAGGIT